MAYSQNHYSKPGQYRSSRIGSGGVGGAPRRAPDGRLNVHGLEDDGREAVGRSDGRREPPSSASASSASGYQVFQPNEHKRQKILSQAERESKSYEQHRANKPKPHYSLQSELGGGSVSEERARRQQSSQHQGLALVKKMERDERRRRTREEEQEPHERKKAEQRKKALENERREQERQARITRDQRKANAKFLDNLNLSSTYKQSSQPSASRGSPAVGKVADVERTSQQMAGGSDGNKVTTSVGSTTSVHGQRTRMDAGNQLTPPVETGSASRVGLLGNPSYQNKQTKVIPESRPAPVEDFSRHKVPQEHETSQEGFKARNTSAASGTQNWRVDESSKVISQETWKKIAEKREKEKREEDKKLQEFKDEQRKKAEALDQKKDEELRRDQRKKNAAWLDRLEQQIKQPGVSEIEPGNVKSGTLAEAQEMTDEEMKSKNTSERIKSSPHSSVSRDGQEALVDGINQSFKREAIEHEVDSADSEEEQIWREFLAVNDLADEPRAAMSDRQTSASGHRSAQSSVTPLDEDQVGQEYTAINDFADALIGPYGRKAFSDRPKSETVVKASSSVAERSSDGDLSGSDNGSPSRVQGHVFTNSHFSETPWQPKHSSSSSGASEDSDDAYTAFKKRQMDSVYKKVRSGEQPPVSLADDFFTHSPDSTSHTQIIRDTTNAVSRRSGNSDEFDGETHSSVVQRSSPMNWQRPTSHETFKPESDRPRLAERSVPSAVKEPLDLRKPTLKNMSDDSDSYLVKRSSTSKDKHLPGSFHSPTSAPLPSLHQLTVSERGQGLSPYPAWRQEQETYGDTDVAARAASADEDDNNGLLSLLRRFPDYDCDFLMDLFNQLGDVQSVINMLT